MKHYGSHVAGLNPKCLQTTLGSSLTIVFARLSAQIQLDSLMCGADDEVVQELWVSHPFFKTGQGHL